MFQVSCFNEGTKLQKLLAYNKWSHIETISTESIEEPAHWEHHYIDGERHGYIGNEGKRGADTDHVAAPNSTIKVA